MMCSYQYFCMWKDIGNLKPKFIPYACEMQKRKTFETVLFMLHVSTLSQELICNENSQD